MRQKMNEYNLGKCIDIQRKLLLVAGFYPKPKRFLYFVSGFINLLLCFLHFISMTVQIVLNLNNIREVSQTLQYYVTHVTFMCKLLNFLFHKKNILELEQTLLKPIFYQFNQHSLSLLKQKVEPCRNFGKVFYFSIVFSVSFFTLMPLLDHERSMNLSVPAWFPYNVTQHFYVTFVLQVASFGSIAYIHASLDIMVWILISIASGQFEILKNNLQNISYSESALKKVRKDLGNCVKHHKEIIKFVVKIEETFSKGIFVQFIASVLVICFTGFLLIIVPLGVQFFYFLFYFLCLFSQIALYCWFGHDVMTTSNKIGEAFYMSKWYMSHLSIRKSVLIFLENTKKPVVLSGGKFVKLTLTTLTAILRTSYSYLAVLQHLYTES